MGIPLHGKSEMFRRAIFRLIQYILASADELHDGQGEIGKSERIRLPTCDEEHFERLRVRLRRQMLAPACSHLNNPLPAFGRTQDAAKGGHALSLEIRRRRLIGRDHKILNQLLGAILLLDLEIGQHLTLKHSSWFNRFKTQRSLFVSSSLEPLRDLVLEAELRIETGDGL